MGYVRGVSCGCSQRHVRPLGHQPLVTHSQQHSQRSWNWLFAGGISTSIGPVGPPGPLKAVPRLGPKPKFAPLNAGWLSAPAAPEASMKPPLGPWPSTITPSLKSKLPVNVGGKECGGCPAMPSDIQPSMVGIDGGACAFSPSPNGSASVTKGSGADDGPSHEFFVLPPFCHGIDLPLPPDDSVAPGIHCCLPGGGARKGVLPDIEPPAFCIAGLDQGAGKASSVLISVVS